MAVQNYIGWPTNVNRVILDSTTIKIGENALKIDELENGNKRSRLRGSKPVEEYSVVMEFDWEHPIENTGKTELQTFYDWYEYQHKCGSVPFEFPKIILSPMTGVRIIDDNNNLMSVEYYKITSAVEGKKSGNCIQVTMTWQSVYGGVVSVPQSTPVISSVQAANGYLDISFSNIANTAPTSSMITLYIDNAEVQKTGFYFDNSSRVRIYFDKYLSGSHTVSFAMSYSGLTVAKGDYESDFTGE